MANLSQTLLSSDIVARTEDPASIFGASLSSPLLIPSPVTEQEPEHEDEGLHDVIVETALLAAEAATFVTEDHAEKDDIEKLKEATEPSTASPSKIIVLEDHSRPEATVVGIGGVPAQEVKGILPGNRSIVSVETLSEISSVIPVTTPVKEGNLLPVSTQQFQEKFRSNRPGYYMVPASSAYGAYTQPQPQYYAQYQPNMYNMPMSGQIYGSSMAPQFYDQYQPQVYQQQQYQQYQPKTYGHQPQYRERGRYHRRNEGHKYDKNHTFYDYTVEFKNGREDHFMSQGNFADGDYVVVEGDRGKNLGTVKSKIEMPSPMEQSLPRIYGRASSDEIQQLPIIQLAEEEIIQDASERARSMGLDLVFTDAEYQFDRKKVTLFYSSAERVDFRSLVRDLFKSYKARIWLSNNNDGLLGKKAGFVHEYNTKSSCL